MPLILSCSSDNPMQGNLCGVVFYIYDAGWVRGQHGKSP